MKLLTPCLSLLAISFATPIYAQMCTDPFEPNDRKAAAVQITAGTMIRANVEAVNADWYGVIVPPGMAAKVNLTFNAGEGMLSMLTHGATPRESNCPLNGQGWALFFNESVVGETCFISVEHERILDTLLENVCQDYELSVDLAPIASCSGPNSLGEPNNTQPTSSFVVPGVSLGYTCGIASVDYDYFETDLPPLSRIRIDVSHDVFAGRLNVEEVTGTLCDPFLVGDGVHRAYWTNTTMSPLTVKWRVSTDALGQRVPACMSYDMEVTVNDLVPQSLVTDGLDTIPHGTPATALRIGPGTYPSLAVERGTRDYYEVEIPAGESIEVRISDVTEDLSLAVNIDAPGRRKLRWFEGAESFTLRNDSASAKVVTFDIDPALTSACDIGASGSGFPTQLGTYNLEIACPGCPVSSVGVAVCLAVVPNSTGLPGRLTAIGERDLPSNNLILSATQLPDGMFGLFLAARGVGFMANPGGSQGNICLGAPMVRFTDVIPLSDLGALVYRVDLGNIPASPTVPVLAGEVWYFQCWHRDVNPTATSNFTDAIGIDF